MIMLNECLQNDKQIYNNQLDLVKLMKEEVDDITENRKEIEK